MTNLVTFHKMTPRVVVRSGRSLKAGLGDETSVNQGSNWGEWACNGMNGITAAPSSEREPQVTADLCALPPVGPNFYQPSSAGRGLMDGGRPAGAHEGHDGAPRTQRGFPSGAGILQNPPVMIAEVQNGIALVLTSPHGAISITHVRERAPFCRASARACSTLSCACVRPILGAGWRESGGLVSDWQCPGEAQPPPTLQESTIAQLQQQNSQCGGSSIVDS